MIAEQVTLRKQVPSADGLWIYRKIDNQYIIRQFVWLGKEDTEWEECTEQEHQEHLAHNAKVCEEQEKAMEAQQ